MVEIIPVGNSSRMVRINGRVVGMLDLHLIPISTSQDRCRYEREWRGTVRMHDGWKSSFRGRSLREIKGQIEREVAWT